MYAISYNISKVGIFTKFYQYTIKIFLNNNEKWLSFIVLLFSTSFLRRNVVEILILIVLTFYSKQSNTLRLDNLPTPLSANEYRGFEMYIVQ